MERQRGIFEFEHKKALEQLSDLTKQQGVEAAKCKSIIEDTLTACTNTVERERKEHAKEVHSLKDDGARVIPPSQGVTPTESRTEHYDLDPPKKRSIYQCPKCMKVYNTAPFLEMCEDCKVKVDELETKVPKRDTANESNSGKTAPASTVTFAEPTVPQSPDVESMRRKLQRAESALDDSQQEIENLKAQNWKLSDQWYEDNENNDNEGHKEEHGVSPTVMRSRTDDRDRKHRPGRSSSPGGRSSSPEVAKIKEGDRIRLGKFPNVNTLESWKADMVLQVIATSGRDSGQVIPWLQMADTDKVTFDELVEVPKTSANS